MNYYCLLCKERLLNHGLNIYICKHKHFFYGIHYDNSHRYVIYLPGSHIEYFSSNNTSYFWKTIQEELQLVGELPGIYLNFDKLNKIQAFL